MEAEVFDRLAELSRVTGFNLDPKKQWYVLKKSYCGIRPNAFAKTEVFGRFPDDCNTFCPASRFQARKQRLFVQHKVSTYFRNILDKIISHKISFSVLKKIKLSLNPNYSHISSILQRTNLKER